MRLSFIFIAILTHLVDTQDFRFPVEMNPLVSVIHNTESTLYMNLVGVDNEKLQPEKVLLEAKDEHKEEKVKLVQKGEFYDYMYILYLL